MRSAWLVSFLGACAGGSHEEAARTAPATTMTASVVVAPEPAPSSVASQAVPAASSASAPTRCGDPTWWLAYLVTLAKSDDARKLAFVAHQTSARPHELDQAQDALAKAVEAHDARALARTIEETEAIVAKNHPACAPPFSLLPPLRGAPDGGLIAGRLDPRVIQHVVRANFGRMKLCYEGALRKDPSTGGRIETKFVIARDGTVASTWDMTKPDAGVPDASMTDCVRKAFATLTFPPPDGGVVTVVYPLIFTPGAD